MTLLSVVDSADKIIVGQTQILWAGLGIDRQSLGLRVAHIACGKLS